LLQHEQPELKRAVAPSEFASWIVWQDADLIAVNKPAGIASQGGEGLAGQNLVDLARAHLQSKTVAVLHRIDRNVSGIVLLAKTTRAARAMSKLIAKGLLERRYEAVVKGRVTAALTLSHWLRKDTRTNQVHLIDAPVDAGQEPAPADHKHTFTRVEPIAELRALIGVCTVINAWPITGRSHQIRAQLAAAGFPIIGDPKYGVEAKDLRRVLLHATHVRFVHPLTHAPIEIDTTPPWTRSSLTTLRRKTKL
jgi:RluA family pseudouridine synthase